MVIVGALAAGATAYGAPGAGTPQPWTTHAAQQAPVTQAETPPIQPAATFDGLDARTRLATAAAAKDGATISVAMLDRATHRRVFNGNNQGMPIASVAKLFIADDLLRRAATGRAHISPEGRKALGAMLRSSDDNAAHGFWDRGGRSAIITRVAKRYGLTATYPPGNDRWWNTVSTATDLIRYYDMLLNGSGGLPPEQANVILNNLAQSTPTGIDGYPQQFGIPEGLYAEPVAVKQGWMCCIGADWMHLSTGVIGPERRYIMVVGSMQPGNDATARATITQAVKSMFPDGHI